MGEADSVTSALQPCNMRLEIRLDDKATLFVKLLALVGHWVRQRVTGHVIYSVLPPGSPGVT